MMREENARAEASVRVARGGVPARTTTGAEANTTVFRVPSEEPGASERTGGACRSAFLPHKPPGERVFAYRRLYSYYVSFVS